MSPTMSLIPHSYWVPQKRTNPALAGRSSELEQKTSNKCNPMCSCCRAMLSTGGDFVHTPAPRGHWAMSEDLFGCPTRGRWPSVGGGQGHRAPYKPLRQRMKNDLKMTRGPRLRNSVIDKESHVEFTWQQRRVRGSSQRVLGRPCRLAPGRA